MRESPPIATNRTLTHVQRPSRRGSRRGRARVRHHQTGRCRRHRDRRPDRRDLGARRCHTV